MNNPLHVLLVEDDPTDILIVQEALEEANIQCTLHSVQDGEAAIAFLERRKPYRQSPRPHLVFLDINLPRMNGQEVLAKIKSSSRLKSIPVIMLSTSESNDDISRAYQHQASCYLVKPNNLDSFADIITSVFKLFTKSLTLNHGHA